MNYASSHRSSNEEKQEAVAEGRPDRRKEPEGMSSNYAEPFMLIASDNQVMRRTEDCRRDAGALDMTSKNLRDVSGAHHEQQDFPTRTRHWLTNLVFRSLDEKRMVKMSPPYNGTLFCKRQHASFRPNSRPDHPHIRDRSLRTRFLRPLFYHRVDFSVNTVRLS